MLLIILSICAILAYVFFVYIKNKTLSTVLAVLALLGMIGSSVLLIKNDDNHYGMHQITETKTQKIYSASPSKQMSMILYQPIGTANKHQVYIYKQSANAKKVSHTQASVTTHNRVKTTTGTNKMTTKTTYWVYDNANMKRLFWGLKNGHQYVKRENTLYVNKQTIVLSTKQAKVLQKKASDKTYQAKMKAGAQAFVEAQVKTAMMKDPSMSVSDREQLTKQAAAEYQAKATQQLINDIKNGKY
ncbi:DUF4811 domain-containing protein [Levilactobacillus bambusae]|uniref:DUF4811 domain-containing protein n=1 Tax=Levilactobacillus bambusae TaxID=2024736 RepID=A0A2V1N0T8_9LACO|nr:DUF4811 domain-containing protein [Levilactobacillus bambusae]PWG00005.1 DUF4811 domain-containing protein [Levilactobacillus bambusae]